MGGVNSNVGKHFCFHCRTFSLAIGSALYRLYVGVLYLTELGMSHYCRCVVALLCLLLFLLQFVWLCSCQSSRR